MNDLMIPIVTVPVMALVLTFRTTSRLLNEVGQMSEELFRGQRLPNVEFNPVEVDPVKVDTAPPGKSPNP